VAFPAIYDQRAGVTHVALGQHNRREGMNDTIRNINECKELVPTREENGMLAGSNPAGEVPEIDAIGTGDTGQEQTNRCTEHKQYLLYHPSSSSNRSLLVPPDLTYFTFSPPLRIIIIESNSEGIISVIYFQFIIEMIRE
jgi:hypothetical protein